jgi:uncharacterized protein (TIGR03118 family)
MYRAFIRTLGLASAAWLCVATTTTRADFGAIVQNNLVSDVPGLAPILDPNMVNPWGVSESGASPFWISENGAGVTTLHNTTGTQVGQFGIPLPTNSVPPLPPGTLSSPTGQVFVGNLSGSLAFPVGDGSNALFIFATEDGTISAWHGGLASAKLEVNNTDPTNGPVFKGLAVGQSGGASFLYAANFRNGTVDMFNTAFQKVGSFTDTTLPPGYAPFNVQNIGGILYVTYALQNGSKHDDVAGLGNGFVDAFTTAGVMLGRIGSNGLLNSPWGLAVAPAGFGSIGGDLLVGNFGDGHINVFSADPTKPAFLGQLTGTNGSPIAIDGLWALIFGNGGQGGNALNLYFTAGIQEESHGLFGELNFAPEPNALVLFGLGGVVLVAARRWRRARNV